MAASGIFQTSTFIDLDFRFRALTGHQLADVSSPAIVGPQCSGGHALLAGDEAQRAAGVTHAMRDGRRTPPLLFEGVGGRMRAQAT